MENSNKNDKRKKKEDYYLSTNTKQKIGKRLFFSFVFPFRFLSSAGIFMCVKTKDIYLDASLFFCMLLVGREKKRNISGNLCYYIIDENSKGSHFERKSISLAFAY